MTAGYARMCRVLGMPTLDGFGVPESHRGVAAGGAVLRYAEELTKTGIRNIHRCTTYQVANFMVIDESSRRNLELVRTMMGGKRKGSLLHLIDPHLLRDGLTNVAGVDGVPAIG